MRVIICGGRGYNDKEYIFRALDAIHEKTPITHVLSGMALGADTWGVIWARQRGLDTTGFHAQWKTHGKAAGPIRNRSMLEDGKPELVIAFPGGKGTANMIEQAKAAGVSIIQLDGVSLWMVFRLKCE